MQRENKMRVTEKEQSFCNTSRHVLTKTSYALSQSDTASVKVPELDLELASGTLGGLVTTVEGLITKVSESEYYL